MSVSVKYKGNEILSSNTTETKTLKTGGKYCEADIVVENTQDGGGEEKGLIFTEVDTDGYPLKIDIPEKWDFSGVSVFRSNMFVRLLELDLSKFTSLTVLPQYFFYSGNTKLQKVILPDNILTIQSFAFGQCRNLEEINLPEGLLNIENDAFVNCQLSNGFLPRSLINLSGLNGNAFQTVDLGSAIQTISTNCFYGNAKLETVYFRGSPRNIGNNCFGLCSKLTNIYVPWSEGEVANAPWGATNATIHYNYVGG